MENATTSTAPEHTKDADCTVDPKTGACTTCKVGHAQPGEGCHLCGGLAFHLDGCSEIG